MKRDQNGNILTTLPLTPDEIGGIIRAYLLRPSEVKAAGGHLWWKEFTCDWSAGAKIQLMVPATPREDYRCLRAELWLDGFPRDWVYVMDNFRSKGFNLGLEKQFSCRCFLQLPQITIPELPSPTWDGYYNLPNFSWYKLRRGPKAVPKDVPSMLKESYEANYGEL